jgi:UDP-N-acetylmuramoyl-tripeptide--D-alanyl-D-alanine ligase
MVYVALRGERYDGHQFLGDAVARGASALVVHADGAVSAHADVGLVVDDTAAALLPSPANNRNGSISR